MGLGSPIDNTWGCPCDHLPTRQPYQLNLKPCPPSCPNPTPPKKANHGCSTYPITFKHVACIYILSSFRCSSWMMTLQLVHPYQHIPSIDLVITWKGYEDQKSVGVDENRLLSIDDIKGKKKQKTYK